MIGSHEASPEEPREPPPIIDKDVPSSLGARLRAPRFCLSAHRKMFIAIRTRPVTFDETAPKKNKLCSCFSRLTWYIDKRTVMIGDRGPFSLTYQFVRTYKSPFFQRR